MAREFNIKTVTSTESIADLHFTVTTSFQDLLSEFTYSELLESNDLNTLVSDANIVTEDENGDSIASFGNIQNDALTIVGVPVDDSNKADGRILKYDNASSSLKYQDESAGGTIEIPICPFGAKSDSVGSFLIANGKSSDADDSSKPKTRQPIPISGIIIGLAYKTKDGDTTTRMKLHINGVVEETITLSSMNANGQGREDFVGPTVDAYNDYGEIEWDGAQKPGECTMTLIIQPT